MNISNQPSNSPAESLNYSKKGLTTLFMWLLWGDFAFVFFEHIFGKFLPLLLKELNASNLMIGVLSGSTVGLINLFFLPNISQWSDNFRSKWGRRIPFLLWSSPLTALTVVLVGYVHENSAWIHRLLSPSFPELTLYHVTMSLICIWVFAFNFFNMILVNSFNWLVVDVVPSKFMGRFLSWFRVVGTVSTCIFMKKVFPLIMEYRHEICLGVASFYTVIFGLMCFRIKEGEYPPVSLKEDRPKKLESYKKYFKECLKETIHRYYFAAFIFAVAGSTCAAPFTLLFTKETLGLTMDQMGTGFAVGAFGSAICLLWIGWICDRMNPLLIGFLAMLGITILNIISYYFLQGYTSMLVLTIVGCLPGAAWGIAGTISGIKIFPPEKYGQFSSGVNVFGCGGMILFNFLSGKFMDMTNSNYRLIYAWMVLFYGVSAFCLWKVYRINKKASERNGLL